MQNRTEQQPQQSQETTTAQCDARDWCQVPGPTHEGEHRGQADVVEVTATGDRSAYQKTDDGFLIPGVDVELVEQTHGSGNFDRQTINLAIGQPAEGQTLNAYLTLHEADLLRRHLVQLLQEVGR